MPLRVLSYLAPSLPVDLFETLVAHLRTELEHDVDLSFDSSRSGPRPGESEPFSTSEVDVAFLCATSYVWLSSARNTTVELVGAGWAPTDPRSAGRPIYFGDVLAPWGGPRSLAEMSGRRLAYNDDVSLSGYHSLRIALAAAGIELRDVDLVRSGSHLRSLELLVQDEVDAAAIDSNVWRRRSREQPELVTQLTPVAALGPHPVQPVVVRAGMSTRLREEIRAALLTAHTSPSVARAMTCAELARFVPVSDWDFRSLRGQLAVLNRNAPVPLEDSPRASSSRRSSDNWAQPAW